MSGTSGSVAPVRRVRDDVRSGLGLMLFSAGTSVAIALVLTLLNGLGK